MWKNIGYEQCLTYIHTQLSPGTVAENVSETPRLTITIARQAGSGGRTVASQLAEYLQSRAPVECHWTVFDGNLIERVLEEHQLPKRLAPFLAESHQSYVTDAVEELLGLHPPTWTMVKKISETILHLAQMGNVILVGRGANVITARLDNVFHVLLVGSLEKRIERIAELHQMDRRRAREFVHREDTGRRRYLKDHFGKSFDDPLLYHLVINTDLVGYDGAAQLIGQEVIRRFHLDGALQHA